MPFLSKEKIMMFYEFLEIKFPSRLLLVGKESPVLIYNHLRNALIVISEYPPDLEKNKVHILLSKGSPLSFVVLHQ